MASDLPMRYIQLNSVLCFRRNVVEAFSHKQDSLTRPWRAGVCWPRETNNA